MRKCRPFFRATLPLSARKIGWGYRLFLVCFRSKTGHRDLLFDKKAVVAQEVNGELARADSFSDCSIEGCIALLRHVLLCRKVSSV